MAKKPQQITLPVSACTWHKDGYPCGKACDPGKSLCPHHLAVTAYEETEKPKISAERAKRTKEHKNAMAVALASSPLAAVAVDTRG
jgi:hypothetical protein